MDFLRRLLGTKAKSSGAYGPNSAAVEQLIDRLRVLSQDELMSLGAAYGAAQGQVPGADPNETKLVKRIKADFVRLPLAKIDRRDRPVPMAVEAGAEAVLAAIWATGLEPPAEVRRLASSGGADLALLMTVRPEADPESWATLWTWYTDELPSLRALATKPVDRPTGSSGGRAAKPDSTPGVLTPQQRADMEAYADALHAAGTEELHGALETGAEPSMFSDEEWLLIEGLETAEFSNDDWAFISGRPATSLATDRAARNAYEAILRADPRRLEEMRHKLVRLQARGRPVKSEHVV